MKIILDKDVPSVGKAYEIKEVNDGYARNFLLPKGLAHLATPIALSNLNKKIQESAGHIQANKSKLIKMATKLDNQIVVVKEKAQSNGKLYGSVGIERIAGVLKESGFEIKKELILLQNPLKELGEFPVEIKFDAKLRIKIKILVEARP